MREPGNEDRLTEVQNYSKTYAKKYAQEHPREYGSAQRAKEHELRANEKRVAAERRTVFTREVPPILSSRHRTRLFISLCEYGPLNGADISLYVMTEQGGPRNDVVNRLVALGIVAEHQPLRKAGTAYYINPGHPAYRELLTFGRALARRWPSPPRQPRPIVEAAVPVEPSKIPCNLFSYEETNRTLLLVAVAGLAQLVEISRDSGITKSKAAKPGLERFVRLGILSRAPIPTGKGARKGQPRPYLLNPNYFAYPELRSLLFALVATIHDDIAGIARGLSKKRPVVALNVAEFERETAHFHRDF